MTLSFSTHINGQPTHFVSKIWNSLYNEGFDDYHYSIYQMMWLEKFGTGGIDDDLRNKRNPKIHTIRADKSNRWKPGNKIHFVIKNRTPDRFQFAPVLTVKSVQKIDIVWSQKFDGNTGTVIVLIDEKEFGIITIWKQEINNLNNLQGLEELAVNDGFDSVKDFLDYFNDDFSGKIIHWTDHRY